MRWERGVRWNLAMMEDPADRRLAGRIVDHIGETLDISVLQYRVGPNAEGGWEFQGLNEQTGERFVIRADTAMAAAVQLADLFGVDLEDG